jgi:hypothetical protein
MIRVPVAFWSLNCYNNDMKYKFSDYFENEVLRKRPYIKKEWCIHVIENPIRTERQENNRFRYWGIVKELEGRVLRVITLEDKKTIHNAFPDRGYKI